MGVAKDLIFGDGNKGTACIPLKKLTEKKVEERYDFLTPTDQEMVVGWWDTKTFDPVESARSGEDIPEDARRTEISPIIVIVHGRLFSESTMGWKKGDTAWITYEAYQNLF